MDGMRWIPPAGWITDKDPKESGFYLTTVRNEIGQVYVDIEQYWDGKWPDVELRGLTVIAWTTLPEPEEGI